MKVKTLGHPFNYHQCPRYCVDSIYLPYIPKSSQKRRNFRVSLFAVLLTLFGVLVFNLFSGNLTIGSPSAKVQFTADVILSLSGISDGDLYIAQNSESDSLTISGSTLTVSGIPAGASFILKTPQYNNALKLTPSGGTLGLTFNSSEIATSTGTISQWTLDGSGSIQVAHIMGTPKANTWYAIKVDGVLFNSFKSNGSGEVSFTYTGGFSSKVFTIEEDLTAPAEFNLVSPINNYSTSDTRPTFSWNASDVPDLDHYALYTDGNLNTDNISGTSVALTSALSCGNHTWYVKAVDKAGNAKQSNSTFTIDIACGGGAPISPVSIIGQGNVSQNLGGEVRKTFESGELAKVVFPTQSIKGTVVTKIEPQVKEEVIKTNPLPQNTQIIGDLVADFKTLSGGEKLEKFEGAVPITFTYLDEQVKESGVDEKTLKIYWWDEATKTWQPLKSEVNTLTNTITAHTSHFTLFAVMGETKEKPIEVIPVEGIKSKIMETITKMVIIIDKIVLELSETINALQSQVSQPSEKTIESISGIPAGYKFVYPIRYQDKGIKVSYLQEFLKSQGTEIYPEGLVNDYFDLATLGAVKRFQLKYGIITPETSPKIAGYVGPATRAKINEILGR